MSVDSGGRRPYAALVADRRGLLEAPHYAEQVVAIVAVMVSAFRAGKKVLWCGNGGSAADAQHLAAEFSGRFLRERGGLPSEALSVNTSALTAIANDFGYEHVFARQVEAFAQSGDVVVGITTSGRSKNVAQALEAAKRCGATAVAFTGNGGGPVAHIADLILLGPHGYSALVQEVHIAMGHIICDLVEQDLHFPVIASLRGASEMLERMRGCRVVVVGDVMIDEWIWGSVSRISPEAPVPVVAVRDHSFTLGGSGNVANNLRALGAQVSFVGAVGNDAEGERVRGLLADIGCDASGLCTVGDRPTTRKTRVVAHNQQVVRADWESTAPLADADRATVVSAVKRAIAGADAVVLSDYAKGLLHREIVEAALGAPIVVADPKPANLAIFGGVTCIAPNAAEAAQATGIAVTDDASLAQAARALLAHVGCRWVLITRGEHGMSLFGADGSRDDVPSVARTVFDVSGAGDTAVAVLTLALAAAVPIATAIQLANFAAGAVVEKLGTATASAAEIVALMEHDAER